MPGSRGPARRDLFIIKSRDGRRELYRSRTCLLPEVAPSDWDWLRFFEHYKKGFLYQAGGVSDQPHKYLEAMELIGGHIPLPKVTGGKK